MAKRRHNKSKMIREMLAEKPDATAKEIIDALAAKRVKVSPAYIYILKSKTGKPKPAALNGIEALVKAKKMSDQLGGVNKARELLALLAKLV
jgi:hypothetical protein